MHAQGRTASHGSLLVIFLTVFIDLLGFGIVLPLLPIYAQQFALDESGLQLGLLMASFSAMQFLFSPFWGRVSDRIGRRPVLMIGLFGSVVFYALFGWATTQQSLNLLFAARIGAGISGATISTAQAYIADCTTPDNRSRGMALIGMAFGFGFTVGPLIGSLAVGSGDAPPGPWPGYVAAGLSAVALLMAAVLLPESRSGAVDPKAAGSEASGHGTAPGAAALLNVHEFHEALTTPTVPVLLTTIFLCVFAFANFETTLSLLISNRTEMVPAFHFSDRGVLWVFAYIGLILALIQGGVVRRVVGRVSETLLAASGAILEMVGFGLMVQAIRVSSVGLLLLALAVVVSGFAFITPSLNGLLSRRTSPERQGGVLGIGQSISSLARIVGSGLGIPLLARHRFLPFGVALSLMVCGLLLIFWQHGRGRDAEAV